MTERSLRLRVDGKDAYVLPALRTSGQTAQVDDGPERDDLSVQDFNTFLSALSPKRWELLGHLRRSGPSSIRALSAAAGRDYKSVHGDVGKLMHLGLIAKRQDGLIEAPFDKVVAQIVFPRTKKATEGSSTCPAPND